MTAATRPRWAKPTFLLLCVLGTLWPLARFLPWFLEHGLDIPLLWQDITASPISRFAWADVVVTVLTIWALVAADRHTRKHPPPLFLPLLASVCVGASLALPLYLYLREHTAEAHG